MPPPRRRRRHAAGAALLALATAAGCSSDPQPADSVGVAVRPFEEVQASPFEFAADPTDPQHGIFKMTTSEPMICAIVWGDAEALGRFNNSLSINGTGCEQLGERPAGYPNAELNRNTGMPSRPSDDSYRWAIAIGQRPADPQHLRGLVDSQQRRVAIKRTQHLDAAHTATYNDVIGPINPLTIADRVRPIGRETTGDNSGQPRTTPRKRTARVL